ncbi:MAG: hypothetical protein KIIPBIDF_00279 [Candidatus Methanoperedenaceae archaeon GB50]|nr:MAG: hypothetical protein KIIPBIDF_00279 [Candidatus Methanoperedenaceae archaeon GB50]
MKVKNVSIPIDIIIELLKKLNEEAKQEIFEKVFFRRRYDTFNQLKKNAK